MDDRTERDFAFVMNRVLYYARNGVTTCGTCGAAPPGPAPVVSLMPCGHPWTELMWTPKLASQDGSAGDEP